MGEPQTTQLAATTDGASTSYLNTMFSGAGQTTGGAATMRARTPNGQLIVVTNGTSSGYFLTDNLRSIVGIVNATKTAAYAYAP